MEAIVSFVSFFSLHFFLASRGACEIYYDYAMESLERQTTSRRVSMSTHTHLILHHAQWKIVK